ncbi:nad(+) adp-ribosyltransferase-3 [Stylonychia lemnae]|uniref:Poly [ADP-ribose] polymerase n=1 Tax=Stylonychia lemnae TaxID=5949 RepID=A0A078AF52_STYLE|nr:nad(+) adp-ribosyltransferase-3 [Stylonychia lemnae]|eukprot:CDW80451.1 nad(+) adp-ribosyltransferase-3 [Stylonychia lemnae]
MARTKQTFRRATNNKGFARKAIARRARKSVPWRRGRAGRKIGLDQDNDENAGGNFDRLFTFTKPVNMIHLNHIKQNKQKANKNGEIQIDTSTAKKGGKTLIVQPLTIRKPKRQYNEKYLVELVKQQKKLSDQKSNLKKDKVDKLDDTLKMNSCCLFCNNRLMIEAVRKNDINQVKNLLADHENISNPFQSLNCQNNFEDAFYLADKLKHYEIIKLFLRDLNSKKERKELPSTLLEQSHTGNPGSYNFNHGIKALNQARGSKEGNDAFTQDDFAREKVKRKAILQKNQYSLPTLKLIMTERKKDKSENDVFESLQSQTIKYVRKGMQKEAEFLLKYDFENQINDLNRLYGGALSGELPPNIVKISVIKQSRMYNMLSPLHCACINPNPNIIKTLLKSVPQFSLPDFNRRNLIHYAAANHNPDVLKFLLANGADPNEVDSMRNTPLMIAAELGRTQNILALLDHFEQKRKAREQAEKEKDKQRKKKILQKPKSKKKSRKPRGKQGGDDEDDEDMDDNEGDNEEETLNINYVDTKNRSSFTALHFAVLSGSMQCVKALLDAGADPNLKTSKSMTPALIASACGYLDILRLLKSHDVDLEGKVHKQRKTALIFACMNGHNDIVEYLIDICKVDINKSDTSKNSPIHYAVAYGWQKLVQILIQRGADLNIKTIWNSTPPSLAIQKYHFQILQILIASNKNDQQPDLYSDAEGRDIIVQNLINFDLNVIQRLETLIKLLNKINLQPNMRDQNGYSAFHYLAGLNISEIAQNLYNSKPDEVKALYNKFNAKEDGKKSSKKQAKDLDNNSENDDLAGGSDQENENDEEDEDNPNKKKQRQEKIQFLYDLLSQYVIQIVTFLEHLGYDNNLISTNSQTPILLAAQPLLYALAHGQSIVQHEVTDISFNQLNDNTLELLGFAFSLKSQYCDTVSNQRNLSKKLYNQPETSEVLNEKDKYNRSNFRFQQGFQGCYFNQSNWLHMLTNIIVYSKKEVNTKPLIDQLKIIIEMGSLIAYIYWLLLKIEMLLNKFQIMNGSKFTYLDFIIVSTRNQMELPHIEELLIDKFPGIENYRFGYRDNCILLLMRHASNNNFDPINTVKMLIERQPQLLNTCDKFENPLLNIAAKLKNIPLTLAYIYQKSYNKNYNDSMGNVALSHAIMRKNFENALYLLQQEQTKVYQYGYKYKHYLNDFIKNGGILTKNLIQKINDSLKDQFIAEPVNIYQLSFECKFFALFHLCKKQDQILLLEVSPEEILEYQNKDNIFLLFALAQSQSYKEMQQNNKEVEEEDNDEDEENEQNQIEDGGIPLQTLEDIENSIEKIFIKLITDYKLSIYQADNSGKTLLVQALLSQNLKVISLIFKELYENSNKKQVLEYILQNTNLKKLSFFNLLLSKSLNIDEKIQIKILQQLNQLLGKNMFPLLNKPYTLDPAIFFHNKSNIDQESPYITNVRQFLYSKHKGLVEIYPLHDLIEAQRYEVVQYLIKNGIKFDSIQERQLINLSALLKDLKLIKILHKEGNLGISVLDSKKQSTLHYSLSDYQNPEGILNINAQNLEVFWYLIQNNQEIHKQAYSSDFRQILTASKHKELQHHFNIKPQESKQQKQVLKTVDLDQVEKDFKQMAQQYSTSSNNDSANNSYDLIDEVSEMQDTHEIVYDMNVQLMKVDLQVGLNGLLRFYNMQLLKEKVNDRFVLWTRWGRINEQGQYQRTPFGNDKSAAVKEFNKIFKQKTGNDFEEQNNVQIKGKYRVIARGKVKSSLNVRKQMKKLQKSIKMTEVKALLKNSYRNANPTNQSIFKLYENSILALISQNLENRNNQRNNSSSHLTFHHIEEARQILDEALDLCDQQEKLKQANNRDEVQNIQEQLMELSNRYYTLIPFKDYTRNGIKFLSWKHQIEREQEELSIMANSSLSFKLAIASIKNACPLQYVINMLPTKVNLLSSLDNQAEYKQIMRYLDAGKPIGSQYGKKTQTYVNNIFSINESGVRMADDNELFNQIHNHWLLWHGTKNENLIGILNQGMKIKPSGVNQAGSLFGSGIYFSDNANKAIDYTSYQEIQYSKEDASFYMLLCEVALGNVANFPSDWESNIYRPPEGSHSVRIMSEKGPDFSQNIYNEDGIIVPVGNIVQYPPIKVLKGNQEYNDINNFADYLMKQEQEEKKKKLKVKAAKKPKKNVPKKKKVKNESDEEMSDEGDSENNEDEEEQQFEQEIIDVGLAKHLEKRFRENKEKDKKFGFKPHMISADYLLDKLKKDIQNLDQESSYTDMAQYIVYSEKQVRVKYIVEFKREKGMNTSNY